MIYKKKKKKLKRLTHTNNMAKAIVTKTTAADEKALVFDEVRKFMSVYIGAELVEAYEVYSLVKREALIKETLKKYAGQDFRITHINIPDDYKITNHCPEGVCPVRIEKEEQVKRENTDTVAIDIETGEPKVAKKATKKKKVAKKDK